MWFGHPGSNSCFWCWGGKVTQAWLNSISHCHSFPPLPGYDTWPSKGHKTQAHPIYVSWQLLEKFSPLPFCFLDQIWAPLARFQRKVSILSEGGQVQNFPSHREKWPLLRQQWHTQQGHQGWDQVRVGSISGQNVTLLDKPTRWALSLVTGHLVQ